MASSSSTSRKMPVIFSTRRKSSSRLRFFLIDAPVLMGTTPAPFFFPGFLITCLGNLCLLYLILWDDCLDYSFLLLKDRFDSSVVHGVLGLVDVNRDSI